MPSISANSIQVMKMCQAFADNSNEVFLYTRKGEDIGTEEFNNIFEYYNIKNNFFVDHIFETFNPPHQLFGFFSAIKCFINKPDLVYGRLLYGCVFSSFLNMKTSYEIHSPPRNLFDLIMMRLLANHKKFVKFVVISNSLKDILVNKYGFDESMIIVAHDGANIIEAGKGKNNLIFSNDFNVGYIGSLFNGRGINLIIEMAKSCPYAFFHIVGGDAHIVNKLKEIENEIGNIYFYGHMKYAEAEKVRNKCDVLLAPYQLGDNQMIEGFSTVNYMSPLKIFEYMSSEKAIIASDLPVLKEILTHDTNVFFCKSDNILDWVNALNNLYQDDSKRVRLGKAAHEHFINNFTWNSRAKKIICDLKSSPNFGCFCSNGVGEDEARES